MSISHLTGIDPIGLSSETQDAIAYKAALTARDEVDRQITMRMPYVYGAIGVGAAAIVFAIWVTRKK